MNKARLAEAGLGSPPFYSRIYFLECKKGSEVGGERWEELFSNFSHPTSILLIKNEVDMRYISFWVRQINRSSLIIANIKLLLKGI